MSLKFRLHMEEVVLQWHQDRIEQLGKVVYPRRSSPLHRSAHSIKRSWWNWYYGGADGVQVLLFLQKFCYRSNNALHGGAQHFHCVPFEIPPERFARTEDYFTSLQDLDRLWSTVAKVHFIKKMLFSKWSGAGSLAIDLIVPGLN